MIEEGAGFDAYYHPEPNALILLPYLASSLMAPSLVRRVMEMRKTGIWDGRLLAVIMQYKFPPIGVFFARFSLLLGGLRSRYVCLLLVSGYNNKEYA